MVNPELMECALVYLPVVSAILLKDVPFTPRDGRASFRSQSESCLAGVTERLLLLVFLFAIAPTEWKMPAETGDRLEGSLWFPNSL